jgi:hypothetical protein
MLLMLKLVLIVVLAQMYARLRRLARNRDKLTLPGFIPVLNKKGAKYSPLFYFSNPGPVKYHTDISILLLLQTFVYLRCFIRSNTMSE